jgi:hypothetical protein
MKVRLDFCDFWPGFPKANNFFYNILKSRFDLELTDQPEYVIYADPGAHLHRLHNCVRIYFGIESFLPDWTECDYALTCHYLHDPRHLRLPYYAVTGHAPALVKGQEDPAQILAQKSKFCSFVVSSQHPRKNKNRAEFYHRLSRYKRVDSGGRFLNNIGGSIPGGPGGKVQFLRDCKFNIAFENASIPGYTTEKLFEALQARCIPIYWGSPRIQEEFNPKSFLNYLDFPSEEALIQRIIELDQHDDQYLEMLRQPCFHNNQPNEFFNLERLLDFFERIFTTRIRPVSRRRPFFRMGRWIALKRNKPHRP